MFKEITNNTTFTGVLVSNRTLSKAKAYAVKNGEKDTYNKLRAQIKELPGEALRITGYHNFKPVESVRALVYIIENKKILKRLDLFFHKFQDVGEAAYTLMKTIVDKNSDIHKTLFS